MQSAPQLLRSLFIALALGLAPQMATGFTCPEHASRRAEVLAAFQAIARSPASYVVLHGTVSAMGPRRETAGVESLPMRVTGRQLGPEGFAAVVELPFQRRVVCADHPAGCPMGFAATAQDVLLFLRRDGGRLVLEPQPCGGTWFEAVDARLLSAITACHVRGACR